jgi:hypothetical protein
MIRLSPPCFHSNSIMPEPLFGVTQASRTRRAALSRAQLLEVFFLPGADEAPDIIELLLGNLEDLTSSGDLGYDLHKLLAVL